ncbi:MAG: hypothetical protein ACYCV7_05920 [Acidimicrobiales bacterium]
MATGDRAFEPPGPAEGPGPDEMELLAAFDRLRPQGGLRWGFDDAMRRLSEQGAGTGASAVPWGGLPDDLWQRGKSARIGQRFAGDVVEVLARILAADARRATDAGMEGPRLATWDALRYLAARVESLESRVDPLGDLRVESTVSAPSPDVTVWDDAVSGWFEPSRKAGPVIVGESGEGSLLAVLDGAGHRVQGVEPRGREAWRTASAAQGGDVVAFADVADFLASADDGSASGVVLAGVVDRVDLSGKLGLLRDAVRVAGTAGTVALLVSDQVAWDRSLPVVARDLAPGRPLHPETWLYLMRRLGVADPQWHRSADGSMHALVGTVGR